MINSRYIAGFAFGVGLTVILMLFLGYQLDGNVGLCKLEAAGSIGETPATCLRSWLGALSGWVAAVAALTIGWPTLRLLRNQNQLPAVESRIKEIHGMQIAVTNFRDWLSEEIKRRFILDYDQNKGKDAFYSYMSEAQAMLETCARDLPPANGVEVRNALSVIETASLQTELWDEEAEEENELSIGETEKIAKRFLRALIGKTLNANRNLTNESKRLANWKKSHLPP